MRLKQARALDLLIASVFATVLIAAIFVDFAPDGGLQVGERPIGRVCLFHAVAGFDCPLCGVSRSLTALMHGRLIDSVTYHPLGPIMAVLFALFAAAAIVAVIRKTAPVIETKAYAVCSAFLIIAAVVIWGIR